jgi:hypothetical protein
MMGNNFELFRELIESSQTEKRGLTFFFGGQTLAGVVVKVIGTEAVEVRSQLFSRAIVRLEKIDAVAVS